jgi:hypothetical protein
MKSTIKFIVGCVFLLLNFNCSHSTIYEERIIDDFNIVIPKEFKVLEERSPVIIGDYYFTFLLQLDDKGILEVFTNNHLSRFNCNRSGLYYQHFELQNISSYVMLVIDSTQHTIRYERYEE